MSSTAILDSSPLPIPPPKKLKRTASVASLPSPPPSVEHLKKRINVQKFTNNSSSDTEPDSDEETVEQKTVVGRKLLFPVGPSSAGTDPDDPFLEGSTPLNARDQLAIDSSSSPSVIRTARPASPPPSRGKTVKAPAIRSKTPPPINNVGNSEASELPILDEDDNPFLSSSPPKLRRARPSRDLTDQPTMTYVFKGVKTSFPNPNYQLPDSAYEHSRLSLSDPEYSPPPTFAPKLLFPEAYHIADDADDEFEESHDELRDDAELQTPDRGPRMSKLFVDEEGNPIPDSGLQGIRGKTIDANEIGRMAVGPIRGRG